jgi:hypothetical protein
MQVVPTNINAHKAREAELRAEANRLLGEADQLRDYIRTIEPAYGKDEDQAKEGERHERKDSAKTDSTEVKKEAKKEKPNTPGKAQSPEEHKVPDTTSKAENLPKEGSKDKK